MSCELAKLSCELAGLSCELAGLSCELAGLSGEFGNMSIELRRMFCEIGGIQKESPGYFSRLLMERCSLLFHPCVNPTIHGWATPLIQRFPPRLEIDARMNARVQAISV